MKQRFIWGTLLLLVIIPIIVIGKVPFALAIGLISILAIKEINDLYKFPTSVKLISFLALLSIVYSNFDSSTISFGLEYKTISIVLLLLFIPIIFYQIKGKYTIDDAFKLTGFIFLVGMGLNYLILIRDVSLKYFFLVILTPMITDTFAYIGGSLIGKHKVTKISPNKSWEGYIIGSLMGTFIMTMYYTTVINVQTNLFKVIGIILLMTIIAQIGDLFFSAIKRHYNIKDFALLIPGHGGVLDRIDSIIFTVLVYVIFMGHL